MLELNLSPIYYRTGLNSPVPFPGLPANASAYAHQLQTYCAVTRTRNYPQVSRWCQTCELAQTCPVAQLQPLPQHGTLCITNSAVTGGGKTLAAYAYGVQHCLTGDKVLGVYPTNELLHDQKRAIYQLFQTIHGRPPTEGIDGELLVVDGDFLRQEKDAGEQNIKLIEYILKRAKIVLTNPDILYLLCHHLYASSRELTGRTITAFSILLRDFRTIIFDEFHLYNSKQQAAVLWLVGLSAQLFSTVETPHPHSFVFSSATPIDEPKFAEKLAALNAFGVATVTIKQPGESHGRPVMEAVKLRLESANLRAWQGEEKAIKLLPELQQLLHQNPHHRCLYVMDAVAAARRLKQELTQLFNPDDVGEAHGFVRPEEKRQALRKRHTTGTSGIEVGIDFTGDYFKDILLFEARTSAQFLQRLGRIGRNGREGGENIAIAIVPPEVLNCLLEYPQLPQPFNRTHLPRLINHGFRYFNPEGFVGYLERYAPLEAEYTSQIYLKGFEYGKNPVTGNWEETQERRITRNQLNELIQTLYPGHNRQTAYKELKQLLANGTISGILGFRDGGGVVEANIYRAIGGKRDNGKPLDGDFSPLLNLEIPYFDYAKSQPAQTFPFHSYSLTYLLRRTHCRFITAAEFSDYLQPYDSYPEAQTYLKQLAQANPMIYAIVLGDLPKPRRWHFYSNSGQYRWVKQGIKQKRDYPILEKVRRISGLSVELEKTEAALDIDILNQALEKRDAIAYIGKGNAFRYAIETHLPPLFELCPFRWGASAAQYYLAFDLNAFFLSSLDSINPACII